MIPLFLPPPWQVFTLEHMMTDIVRERVYMAGEERSTINFGRVRVRTPAACATGEWFINCSMPLRQVRNSLISVWLFIEIIKWFDQVRVIGSILFLLPQFNFFAVVACNWPVLDGFDHLKFAVYCIFSVLSINIVTLEFFSEIIPVLWLEPGQLGLEASTVLCPPPNTQKKTLCDILNFKTFYRTKIKIA